MKFQKFLIWKISQSPKIAIIAQFKKIHGLSKFNNLEN